ncbi:MAG: hypothetical protein L6R39_001329 [Caloplaca ligustica]|nr:MAG: hypothetical protein L6R39_001329 [Caloplaca ligustica]
MSFCRTASRIASRKQLNPIAQCPRRYSSVAEPDLKSSLREVIPAKRELLKKVKSHASKTIGEVKIENTLGGMRYACHQI